MGTSTAVPVELVSRVPMRKVSIIQVYLYNPCGCRCLKFPQLSAIYNVSKAIRSSRVWFTDGGCSRRYCQGVWLPVAQSVMACSLFARVEESPVKQLFSREGEIPIVPWNGLDWSNATRIERPLFPGCWGRYQKLVPEGIVARDVPPIADIGTRPWTRLAVARRNGYCSAPNIEKLHDAKFVRITNAGIAEKVIPLM